MAFDHQLTKLLLYRPPPLLQIPDLCANRAQVGRKPNKIQKDANASA